MVSLPRFTMPSPEDVRRIRVRGQTPLDVWDAAACGLTEGEGCLDRLAALHMDHAGAPDRKPDRGATTYLAREPCYAPHESKQVPRYETTSKGIGSDALRAAFSREVLDSVMASPLAATMLVAAALFWSQLVSSPAGRTLDALAGIAAKKGGEVDRLLPEYCARHADTPNRLPPWPCAISGPPGMP